MTDAWKTREKKDYYLPLVLGIFTCLWLRVSLTSSSDTLFAFLKASLHQAIFCAICLVMFKSVALQLHEQGCQTAQWDCQQLAKLRPRRTGESIIRILISWSSKGLRDKLLEGWLHCVTMKKSIKSLLRRLWKVGSSSAFCNACGKTKIARQVARNIA